MGDFLPMPVPITSKTNDWLGAICWLDCFHKSAGSKRMHGCNDAALAAFFWDTTFQPLALVANNISALTLKLIMKNPPSPQGQQCSSVSPFKPCVVVYYVPTTHITDIYWNTSHTHTHTNNINPQSRSPTSESWSSQNCQPMRCSYQDSILLLISALWQALNITPSHLSILSVWASIYLSLSAIHISKSRKPLGRFVIETSVFADLTSLLQSGCHATVKRNFIYLIRFNSIQFISIRALNS